MKFALQITDATPSELATILATLNGTVSGGAMVVASIAAHNAAAATAAESEDDDTSGDNTAVAPGTVDKNGLPWDDRIHSTPATLTGKGVWRAKRGMTDKAFVAAIEAELRARSAAPVQQQQMQPVYQPQQQPQQPYQPQQQMQQQPYQPQQQMQPAVQQQPVYQPQPQQQPVYQPPMQPAPGSLDFGAFMQKIQQLLQLRDPTGAPLVDANYLNSVSQRTGAAFQQPISAITDLAANPAMIDYAIGMMFSEGKWA